MYRINDIFYSIQGEGYLTGCSALFVRFAGCNLRCPFCDTDHETFHEWDADYIVTELLAHCVDHGVLHHPPMVVLTGGEPTLQVDAALVDMLHAEGFSIVAMESNGLLPAPANIDWLTVSPKAGMPPRRKPKRLPDEIKIVFEEDTDPEKILSEHLAAFSPKLKNKVNDILLYVQPCDTGNPLRNKIVTDLCVDYVKRHSNWRLSLQTHKLIGID